jgi:2,3-diaminopropionate biosynthesis protein SbnA
MLAMRSGSILENVGKTPLIKVQIDGNPYVNLYAKLEFMNPTGSVKDRAASTILKECFRRGIIDAKTTIIESSSGNFGVALAAYCQLYKLRFVCVIDPNITAMNEMLLRSFNAEIVKVEVPDQHGGYLLTRIKKVKEIMRQTENIYWTDQYNSSLNALAYYESLGGELCRQFDNIDYVFAGVSSGGTISGMSRRIKEHFPQACIVAVDSVGSVIFDGVPQKRYIPGIGSSMRPGILREAMIDETVLVEESQAVRMCHQLLRKHFLFAGGSSGSVVAAVHKYFETRPVNRPVDVVAILADKGEKYMTTVYNKAWYEDIWGEDFMADYGLPELQESK